MSTLDWTISQALAGQTAEAALYALRARHESTLVAERQELERRRTTLECREAELAATAADAVILEPSAQYGEVLALARLEFPRLAERARRAEADEDAFRVRHGLTRPPITPNAIDNAMLLGIIALGEGAANGTFFATAHMTAGPLSAFAASGMIAGVNVVWSAVAGHCAGRRLGYGQNAIDADSPDFRRTRAIGKIGTAVAVAGIGLVHLSVGLVRSQETFTDLEHSLSAYANVLTSVPSLFLVLLGCALSVISWGKAKNGAFSDPYLDYGEMRSAVDDAVAEASAKYEELARSLDAQAAAQIDVVDDVHKRARSLFDDCNKLRSQLAQKAASQEARVHREQSAFRAEVATLINHHRSARGPASPVDPDGLDESLTSFDEFLPGALPPAVALADVFDASRQKIAEAHVDARRQLDTLFTEIFGRTP